MKQNVRHSVGDRVVALITSNGSPRSQPIIKNKAYTVEDVLYCPKCGSQKINVGYCVDRNIISDTLECSCGGKVKSDYKHWTISSRFAPLSETALQNAIEEENYELASIIRDALKTEKV